MTKGRALFHMPQSRILSDRIRWVMVFLLVGYTALVAYWMLFGFGRVEQAQYHYNLQPLHTIEQFLHIRHSHTKASAINLLGNFGVFVPFGVLIPLATSSRRKVLARLTSSLCIFLVGDFLLESIQLVTKRGSFDVDDLILNTIGALCGLTLFAIFRAIYLRINPSLAIES